VQVRSLMGLPLVLPATSARMVAFMRSLDWMILRHWMMLRHWMIRRRRGNLGSRLVGRGCLRRSLMCIGIRVVLRRLGAIGLMIVIVSFGSVAVPTVAILPASTAPEAKARPVSRITVRRKAVNRIRIPGIISLTRVVRGRGGFIGAAAGQEKRADYNRELRAS
jgi:hypothetical protein